MRLCESGFIVTNTVKFYFWRPACMYTHTYIVHTHMYIINIHEFISK